MVAPFLRIEMLIQTSESLLQRAVYKKAQFSDFLKSIRANLPHENPLNLRFFWQKRLALAAKIRQ
jgi:hypothetical protein